MRRAHVPGPALQLSGELPGRRKTQATAWGASMPGACRQTRFRSRLGVCRLGAPEPPFLPTACVVVRSECVVFRVSQCLQLSVFVSSPSPPLPPPLSLTVQRSWQRLPSTVPFQALAPTAVLLGHVGFPSSYAISPSADLMPTTVFAREACLIWRGDREPPRVQRLKQWFASSLRQHPLSQPRPPVWAGCCATCWG